MRFHLRCWFSRTGCDSSRQREVAKCVFFSWLLFWVLQLALWVRHFGLYRTCTQRTRRCIRPFHCILFCKYLSWSELWVQPVEPWVCAKKRCKIVTDVRSNQHTLTSKAHELGLGLPLKLDATVKMVTGATAELTEEQRLDLFKRCPMSVMITSHGNAWFYHHWTTFGKLCYPLWSGGVNWLNWFIKRIHKKLRYFTVCSPCLRGWFQRGALERGAHQIMFQRGVFSCPIPLDGVTRWQDQEDTRRFVQRVAQVGMNYDHVKTVAQGFGWTKIHHKDTRVTTRQGCWNCHFVGCWTFPFVPEGNGTFLCQFMFGAANSWRIFGGFEFLHIIRHALNRLGDFRFRPLWHGHWMALLLTLEWLQMSKLCK